jgi:hypothetical protein
MSDQPEALRLAEQLKERFGGTVPTKPLPNCAGCTTTTKC